MSLRGTAPNEAWRHFVSPREPLWTLGNQRKDPLDSSVGVHPKGDEYTIDTYMRHTGKLNLANRRKIRYRSVNKIPPPYRPRLAIIKTLITAVQYDLLNRLHTRSFLFVRGLKSESPNDLQGGVIHKRASPRKASCAPSRAGK